MSVGGRNTFVIASGDGTEPPRKPRPWSRARRWISFLPRARASAQRKSPKILQCIRAIDTLIADYSITKDGVVFGIITREQLSGELELPKGSFVDETFRFRVNVEGKELTVKNVRLPVPRIVVEPQVAKAWEAVNEAQSAPFLAAGIGLLRLEGHLSGTYERTTMEKAGMNRNPIPSRYVESPGPAVGPPSSLPTKGNR